MLVFSCFYGLTNCLSYFLDSWRETIYTQLQLRNLKSLPSHPEWQHEPTTSTTHCHHVITMLQTTHFTFNGRPNVSCHSLGSGFNHLKLLLVSWYVYERLIQSGNMNQQHPPRTVTMPSPCCKQLISHSTGAQMSVVIVWGPSMFISFLRFFTN